jgi:predicted peroxiredoxin
MKNIILSAAIAATLVANTPAYADGHAKDHLYITVSSEDINQVGMMMTIAGAAIKTGRTSSIVLGADGFRNALKDGPQDRFPGREGFPGKDKMPRELLTDYIAAGGEVLVCGQCLTMYGVTEDDLIDGVKLVNGKQVVEAIFASDHVRTLGF